MKRFKQLIEEGYEGLEIILSPKGKFPYVTKETGKDRPNGICLYKTIDGSFRWVYKIDNEIVSAVQVMSVDGINGKIANAFTKKGHRGFGYASELLKQARKVIKNIEHSDDLSDDGKQFAKKTR